MAYPETRPDGSPLVTSITPDLRAWLCRGGVDPARVIPLGITEAALVALWNVRIAARECEFATPDDRAATPPPPAAPST